METLVTLSYSHPLTTTVQMKKLVSASYIFYIIHNVLILILCTSHLCVGNIKSVGGVHPMVHQRQSSFSWSQKLNIITVKTEPAKLHVIPNPMVKKRKVKTALVQKEKVSTCELALGTCHTPGYYPLIFPNQTSVPPFSPPKKI